MLKSKTIFITGGAGFIANTLIKHYITNNKIIVYDNFHRDTLTSSNVANHKNLKIIKGDVLDLPLLTNSMKGADIVVHAAGIAGIDTVIKDPVRTMTVNMIGTANALEAAKVNKINDRFVDLVPQKYLEVMLLKVPKKHQLLRVVLAKLDGFMPLVN